MVQMTECARARCNAPALDEQRLCGEHYEAAVEKARAKLGSSVSKPGGDAGCWIWTGATQQQGYGYMGTFGLTSNSKPAHWVALAVAEDSDFDLENHGEVHHTCGERACVNPTHLMHMKTEFHELLHQLSSRKVALVVLDHLLEAYPDAETEIATLREALEAIHAG